MSLQPNGCDKLFLFFPSRFDVHTKCENHVENHPNCFFLVEPVLQVSFTHRTLELADRFYLE